MQLLPGPRVAHGDAIAVGPPHRQELPCPERDFFIADLLVRIHFIIVMIRWTGPAPWEFEFPLPGSLISTFEEMFQENLGARPCLVAHRATVPQKWPPPPPGTYTIRVK